MCGVSPVMGTRESNQDQSSDPGFCGRAANRDYDGLRHALTLPHGIVTYLTNQPLNCKGLGYQEELSLQVPVDLSGGASKNNSQHHLEAVVPKAR